MNTVGYIRVSTHQQDAKNQKFEILTYAQTNQFSIDRFIEVEMSSRKTTKERHIDSMVEDLTIGDCIIVSELSRLGRSTHEVIGIVNLLIKKQIKLICIKQNLTVNSTNDFQTKIIVTMFSLFSELERDMISERTKIALAAKKASGVKLGRRKGSLGKSILDCHGDQLREFKAKGVSISSIAKIFNVSRGTVYNYIESRKMN